MPNYLPTVAISLDTARDAALWIEVLLRTIPQSPLHTKIAATREALLEPVVKSCG